MDSYRLHRMSNDYIEAAMLGTWARTGPFEYTRCSGEVVTEVATNIGSRWSSCDGRTFYTLFCAMVDISMSSCN